MSHSIKKDIMDRVSAYTIRDYLRIPSNDSISEAAKKMLDAKATEAVVCNFSGTPMGIFTERDVLYRVVATGKDPRTTRVIEVMSVPIATIDELKGIDRALLKMKELGVRRLGVTRDGRLIGLVTQNSIVTKRSVKDMTLDKD